jgi:hypothetical protein
MDDPNHPRVFFPSESRFPFPSDSPGEYVAYGYLFIVDGIPWAAKTLEDARAGVPAIPTQLDPQLLEEVPSSGSQPRHFRYRGLAPRA